MSVIKQLSPDVIAKIAAGEVIERPAYAIKELIDNAIDAQATSIQISLEDAGLKKIHCIDNGIGMSKDDLRHCFLAHTTSKISSSIDLYNIHTLGFRGEALWSIAAISKITIKSREKNAETGNEIEINDGNIDKLQSVGIPEGTEIIIENLFHNTPTRKKFLNSTTTELRLITELVISFALVYPHIRFQLSHNKKKIIDLPTDETKEQRIKILHGAETYQQLLRINNTDGYLTISGFIGKPQSALTTTHKQFIFVNNRRVYDKTISSTIKESFGTLLEPKLYPIFYLFLDLPYERVDINVHPRKEQVAFAEKQLIIKAIQNTITQAITNNDLKYYDLRWNRKDTSNHEKYVLHDGGTSTYAGNILKSITTPRSLKSELNNETIKIEQFHRLYIIVETKAGILLIDQHAAHERILYEQFLNEFEKVRSKNETINIRDPILLDIPPTESLILEEHQKTLQKIGFTTKKKGSSWLLTQIPAIYKDRNYKEIIIEALNDIAQNNNLKDVDQRTHKMLSYLACRSAIKAGERLTYDEMKNLINKLNETKTQYTCPHGRPVQVEVSLNEIHKLFHRK